MTRKTSLVFPVLLNDISKKVKWKKIKNKEVKISLLLEDDSIDFTRKARNIFTEVLGYKINIKNATFLMYQLKTC